MSSFPGLLPRGGTGLQQCSPKGDLTQTLHTLPWVCLVVHRTLQDFRRLQGDLCLQQRPKIPPVQASNWDTKQHNGPSQELGAHPGRTDTALTQAALGHLISTLQGSKQDLGVL